MKLFFYNLLFPVGFVLYLPEFIYKLVRRGGYSQRFMERFGWYKPDRQAQLGALDRPVWVHAVSVGEVMAAAAFIRRWRERRPGLDFVLSTTTTTGYRTAAKRLPDGVVLVYNPLDFAPFVRAAFTAIAPRLVVIFEVEFWPNMIVTAARRGIPLALANGRMSDHSARGYARFRWFFHDLFRRFSLMCVQTEVDADRVRRVVPAGVPIHVCNTMKFDLIPDAAAADLRPYLRESFGLDNPLVWVAGSTHGGEEAWVLATYGALRREFPGLRLVLVPRHQERTAEVVALLEKHGLRYRLRRPGGEQPAAGNGGAEVLLVNTTGELMDFYAAADLVFVGKSLAGNHGGHNIIEPAIHGKAIVYGENMENFRAVAGIFRSERAAVECADAPEAFRKTVAELLRSPERRKELARRARAVVEKHRGAIDRTIDLLAPLAEE